MAVLTRTAADLARIASAVERIAEHTCPSTRRTLTVRLGPFTLRIQIGD